MTPLTIIAEEARRLVSLADAYERIIKPLEQDPDVDDPQAEELAQALEEAALRSLAVLASYHDAQRLPPPPATEDDVPPQRRRRQTQ